MADNLGPALTQLVPMSELTPGAVGAIRNQIINSVVAQVSRELSLPVDGLVVRDVRPVGDLQMYQYTTTDATIECWSYEATTGSTGFTSVTGAKTMADQRYVVLFGVRDLRWGWGGCSGATGAISEVYEIPRVSQIKINVGGADKVIWDIESLYAHKNYPVGFTSSGVLIPQNIAFNIYYYRTMTQTDKRLLIQLIGVTVEPRGKLISP